MRSMTANDDHVVLVNERNEVLGTAPKATVHTANTPLHRGFSVFLFNDKGELLLQQRSLTKKTWPGVWSNSCCGHPRLGEEIEDAARRRVMEELGLSNIKLIEVLPDYRYRYQHNGVVEYELCPVFVGITKQHPRLNKKEVSAMKWVAWTQFVSSTIINSPEYSHWALEISQLLAQNKAFEMWFNKNTTKK